MRKRVSKKDREYYFCLIDSINTDSHCTEDIGAFVDTCNNVIESGESLSEDDIEMLEIICSAYENMPYGPAVVLR